MSISIDEDEGIFAFLASDFFCKSRLVIACLVLSSSWSKSNSSFISSYDGKGEVLAAIVWISTSER